MTELLPGWAWRCDACGRPTLEPHSGYDGEDLCPLCCDACTLGHTRDAQEQYVKEHSTALNPGDAVVGHGIPDREQMAAAEGWVPLFGGDAA